MDHDQVAVIETTFEGLPTQTQLLLLCLQEQSDATAERIRILTQDAVHWDSVFQQACRHSVAPLFYWRTRKAKLPAIPPEIAFRLEQRFQSVFHRNFFLTGELVKISRCFQQHGIPMLAYKGPLLAAHYENIGLREFHDLDLLIREEDVPRVHQLLGERRFLPRSRENGPGKAHSIRFARAFDFEMTYENLNSGTLVDLHWALMPDFFALPAEARQVWERTLLVDVGGSAIQTLGAEDLLLLLCLHGTKHVWGSLGWVCDVAQVLRAHPNLDWGVLLRRAMRFRTTRALHLGLFLAIELLNAQVPEFIRQGIASDAKVHWLARSVRIQLFEDPSWHLNTRAQSLFLMRSRDTLRDSLRCGMERVFQPTKAEGWVVDLPRALFALYYLLRPMRLLGKYVASDSRSPRPHQH